MASFDSIASGIAHRSAACADALAVPSGFQRPPPAGLSKGGHQDV